MIFEGEDPEMPDEQWVAAPVKKGKKKLLSDED
jgi:hypothetical protein